MTGAMDTRFGGLAVLLAAALLCPRGIGAQTPNVPVPRDRMPVTTEGTAILKGRVVDALTGTAIPRARVRLSGRGNRLTTTTDASGAFAFSKLPAGSFVLHAEKAGYIGSSYPGGRTVRMRMKPVVLADGQSLEKVTIQMFRASAITGRVVDAHGDPVEFAQVQALRLSTTGKPSAHGSQSTNDIGEFRLGRLEPGSYLVLASAPRMHSEPGRPPGSESISALPIPTYFPGVASIEQAQPITLGRGESVAGIELVLGEGAAIVVTGTVVTAEGQRVIEHGWVNAQLVHGDVRIDAGGSGLHRDGTFRFELAPGEYVLRAHATQAFRGRGARPDEKIGMLRLTVGSSPIESVTIVVGGGAVATGRVVFEGTTPPPPPPAGPVWIPLHSDESGMCGPSQAQINADWTFRIEGLFGTCTAPQQPTFGRWSLKSVSVDGEEVLTRSLTFEPGQQLRNIQVVFTDRRSSMTFRVTDEAGQPTREYVVLAFFTDRSRWQKGPFVRTYLPPQLTLERTTEPRAASPITPLVPARRPETMAALVPGEYYVVAVDDIEVEAIRSMELLDRLIPSAARVSVGEGTNVTVPLRRVKLEAR